MEGGRLAGGVGVACVAADACDARHWEPHLPVAGHNLYTRESFSFSYY